MKQYTVTTSDNCQLAVYEWHRDGAPTVLCIHGFPDDHSAWTGLAEALSPRLRVVAFDVRGSGRSDRPARVRQYRLDQLADDISTIIDACSPGIPVHVVGHDWGSIQAWHAATDPALQNKIASLTSISGPYLDAVPAWLRQCVRGGLSGWRAIAGMWKSPLYIGLFQLPIIRELLCRSGLTDMAVRLAEYAETGSRPPDLARWRARKNWQSVKMYRANMFGHLLRPFPRQVNMPVQVLAPRKDLFVTVASQTAVPVNVASRVDYRLLDGGHWVPVFDPQQLVPHITQIVAARQPATPDESSAL
jgi:pimeloyl-ACP methyl ester carboxylesterase